MGVVLYFITVFISSISSCSTPQLEARREYDLQLVEGLGAPAKDTHINEGFAIDIVKSCDLKSGRDWAGTYDQDQPDEWQD